MLCMMKDLVDSTERGLALLFSPAETSPNINCGVSKLVALLKETKWELILF